LEAAAVGFVVILAAFEELMEARFISAAFEGARYGARGL